MIQIQYSKPIKFNADNLCDVPPLKLEEGVSLMKQLISIDENQEKAAGEIVIELSKYPFALIRACEYITANELPVNQYLPKLNEKPDILFEFSDESEYPDSLKMPWRNIHETLKKETPSAFDLLNICVYFAPISLPMSWFENWCQTADRSLVLRDLIIKLRQRGFIENFDEGNSKSFAFHRLVHRGMKLLQSASEKEKYKTQAFEILQINFPKNESSESALWLQHASVLLERLDKDSNNYNLLKMNIDNVTNSKR